jgi:hypothetical protein
MVDLAEIQAAYYMVAATGVLVAAVFYIINLRETAKNRRVALTTSLMQSFISEEGSKRFMELMNMEWKDMSDFDKKYDSSVNLDNFAKRNTLWNTCEILGYQYRCGLIDFGTLWAICNNAVPTTYVKFKPVLDEYKRRGWHPQNMYENFEYLAFEISRKMEKMDPSFKASGVFKSDEYYEAFRRGKSVYTSQ